MISRKLYLGLLATASAAAFAGQAQAAGTAAGTAIDNTATLGYSTGGVAQPNVTSNTASFVVDRRVNLTVAEVGGGATASAPNQANQVTTFTVTNTTNATQDFLLTVTQDAGGTGPFGGTDNFNGGNVRVFAESGATAGYQAAEDTATFVDELAADTNRTVYVVVDIPAGQANASVAAVALTAQAAEAGVTGTAGAATAQTAGAETAGTVDIVFGDGATSPYDANRDGRASARDQYTVSAATMTLTKVSSTISDPFNNLTNPKRIPGALVEYCLVVANNGSAAATSVAVSDGIPANLTYSTGTIFTGVTVGGTAPNYTCSGGTVQTDAVDGDNASFGSNSVSANFPTVNAGATTAVRFRTTVN